MAAHEENRARRIVITGMGVVSPLGAGIEAYTEGLREGRSGVRTITLFDPEGFPTRFAGEVDGFSPTSTHPGRELGSAQGDRKTRLGQAAVEMAIEDAGLEAAPPAHPESCGVSMGVGIGESGPLADMERWARTEGSADEVLCRDAEALSPENALVNPPNRLARLTAARCGFSGPCYTNVANCAAGTMAVGTAMRSIARGDADLFIAGGADSMISPLLLAGFCALGALSERNEDPPGASRPFDCRRDGFVLGEGAGMVVLEELGHARARGARIYAELAGFGTSLDAFRPTDPPPDGMGAIRAMRAAIEDARLTPDRIDHINAHGTSTIQNDRIEALAIREVFGDRAAEIPVCSTKSMMGHLIAAAGAVELIACVQSLVGQVLFPTINQEAPDPECGLDTVPNRARPAAVETILSNSFGFGGQNACLVVQRGPV